MGLSSVFIPDHKRRRGDQDDGVIFLLRSGLGLGNSLGLVQAHASRLARVELARSSVHS